MTEYIGHHVGVPLVGTRDCLTNTKHPKSTKHQGRPQGIAPTINRDNITDHDIKTIKNRQSIRLKKYDYSQNGLYFITIVTQSREDLFGEIIDNKMVLNIAGQMIEKIYNEIVIDFTMVKLHKYIIMPNHIHGIIEIVGVPLVGTRECSQPNKTIGDIIGVFKSITTNRYIEMVREDILPPFNKRIWQRNYWDHIIRDEDDYNKIAEYIANNPFTWRDDTLNRNNDAK